MKIRLHIVIHPRYAANVEMAEVVNDYIKSDEPLKEVEKVATPNKRTIDEVASFLDVEVSTMY